MRRKSVDSATFRSSSNDEAALSLGGEVAVVTGVAVHRGSVDSNDSSDDGQKNADSHNINMRAAVIHVLGDFIQSVGVFVAALIIKFYVSS